MSSWKKLFPALVVAMLVTAVAVSGITLAPSGTKAASYLDSLIYRMDFVDAQNLGNNTLDNAYADAVITGAPTTTQNAIKGATAANFSGGAPRTNFVSLPTTLLQNEAMTLSGWFKMSSGTPMWSRLWEINNIQSSNSRIIYMPYSNVYNGLKLEAIKNNVSMSTQEDKSNVMNHLMDPAAFGNAPANGFLLPMFDAWVHMAFTMDANGITIIQNGAVVASFSGNYTPSDFYHENGTFYLFAANDGTGDFVGSMSDVRIYNAVLTAEQVKSEYSLTYTDFLTTEYTFDNGLNESVRGYNAVARGAAKTETITVGGQQKSVLTLDGSVADANNFETRTSIDLPDNVIYGHRQLTISTDVYIEANTPLYTRIYDLSCRGERYLALYVGFGSAGNLYFETSKFANGGKRYVLSNTNYACPYEQWVNITVSLTGTSATLYVNGVPIATSDDFLYDNGMFWDATDIMDTTQYMSVGRTQYYNDNPFIGYYDNVRIYATALTQKEIMTELGIITIQDDAEAVASEKSKLSVEWEEGDAQIDLPTYVGEGVAVAWQSSNTEIVDTNGRVIFPSAPTEVTLTATLQRGDIVETKQFVLTVKPTSVNVIVVDTPFLGETNFLDGSRYAELMEANLDFMMSLDKERLLYNYRRIAGLDTKGATTYGAWISPESNGAGQFEAHYVLALSKAARTMPNYSYNGETVLERLTYMVNELRACQVAYAALDPENAGYLNAILVENFDRLEKGESKLSNGTSVWVPWYFAHKQLEMSIDVYTYAPTAALRETAYAMLYEQAEWVYNRMSKLTSAQLATVLAKEYGGIAETLYMVYGITGKANHFKAATYFEEGALLTNIHNNIDVLDRCHANTFIPKILACAQAYEQTGDIYYKTICENFWSMVMKRTYATGGTGIDEFFEGANTCSLGNGSMETCCSYNMLRLSDYLFSWTKDVKYMDYYERAFENHILASMNPETGCKTYLVNSAFGFYKIYHTVDKSFWCCTATGTESYAKLPENVYYITNDTVYVNLFYPTTLRNEKFALTQSGLTLSGTPTTITIDKAGSFTVALRHPYWTTTPAIQINGTTQTVVAQDGYYYLTRTWAVGDVIAYTLPMTYRLEERKGGTEQALMYGPTLLVADLGEIGEADHKVSQTDFGSAYTGSALNYMVTGGAELASLITKSTDASGNTYFTMSAQNQTLTFRPFNELFDRRYAMYLNYYASEAEADADYTVVGNELRITFNNATDAALFDSYAAGAMGFSIGNGVLNGSASGESKYMLKNFNPGTEYMIDVTVSPLGGVIGTMNGGVYLAAKNAGNALDAITAYNVCVVKESGTTAASVYVYKFNQGYDGSLVSVGINTLEDGSVKLHIVVRDGNVKIFVNDSKMCVLSFEMGTYTDGTMVGLRSQISPMTFDDFRIVSPSIAKSSRALAETIDAALAINKSNFVSAEIPAFEAALAAAQSVLENASSTQADYNSAEEALALAMAALVKKGDATMIKAVLNEIAKLNRDLYTAPTLTVLDDIVNSCQGQNLDDMAEDRLAMLEDALYTAFLGLKHKTPDKTELNALIASAEALVATDYVAGFEALQSALAAARTVVEDADATATEISAARIALLEAMVGLEKKVVTESGCGGLVGGAGVLAIPVLFGAVLMARKKKQD